MLFSGRTKNAKGNYSGKTANTVVDLIMNTLWGDVRKDKTLIFPFGLNSLPPDGLTCVHAGMNSFTESVVLGFINALANCKEGASNPILKNVQDLKKGESQLFNSADYAFRMELEGILVKWFSENSKADIETKIAIGVNIVNLMLAVYSQMLAHINEMNLNWLEKFNTHTHKYNPGPGPSADTAVADLQYQTKQCIPEANFTNLKNQLDVNSGNTCYIDKNGKIYTIVGNEEDN